jgi:hypothetical protein
MGLLIVLGHSNLSSAQITPRSLTPIGGQGERIGKLLPPGGHYNMKANPESKIIREAKTRDGVTAFLHEDGTISNRLTTFGFSAVPVAAMHKFFDRIGNLHSGDVAKSIRESKKGKMPPCPSLDAMDWGSRDRFDKAKIEIIYNRSIKLDGRC